MTTVDYEQLGATLAAGAALSPDQQREVVYSRDLIGLGMLAADVRARLHGTRGTFVRVHVVDVARVDAASADVSIDVPAVGEAGTFAMGEVRLEGAPASLDAACRIATAASAQFGVPVSGWAVHELAAMGPLADVAVALRAAGLHAVATGRLDRLSGADLEALAAADLPVQVVTFGAPVAGDALVAQLDALRSWQAASGVVRACSPLPVETSPEQPTTGYDDMRHVAIGRIVLDNVVHISAQWARMGAKLSQACLLFGGDDVDAVPALDAMPHGPRRAIVEEVRRNLVAASLDPVERDGAWEPREGA